MADVSVLDVLLYGDPIGSLTLIPGERTVFGFTPEYVEDAGRSTLSLSFKDRTGGLITQLRPTTVRVPPFFANTLPEGSMRDYLARRAGVNRKREFFLLWVLGRDLPGAVTVVPTDGEAWPPEPDSGPSGSVSGAAARPTALRFSLAGVQLKFSAVDEAAGGLTIPAEGVGGSWIVKLPSATYQGVPQNEYSMMQLARRVGIEVPDIELVELASIGGMPEGVGEMEGLALAVRRFDRAEDGSPVHMEDFAQVFGLFPDEKYGRASYRNLADVIAAETGTEGIAEFVRRLVFNTLIGNADMHLKNWSLIYPDRRNARLAPAYDFVSTVAYIPDTEAALKYATSKRMTDLTPDELAILANKASLPMKLVLDTAAETVSRFHDAWRADKGNLPMFPQVVKAIDKHLAGLPIARL